MFTAKIEKIVVLTSFFSKSKPINYIVVGLYMLLLYIIAHIRKGFPLEIEGILCFLLGAVLYIIPMLLLNLVVQKNSITNKGTYTILLYAFLTGMLPDALTNISILVSSFLLMLGLNNVLLFKNPGHIKAKIFNAAMFIALSSLAFFWSIAFLIPVFLAISYYASKNYRNWIIPVIAILMIYVLTNCFTLLWYDSFFSINAYVDPISILFTRYLEKDQIFSSGTIFICLLFFLMIYVLKFKRKPANIKPVLRLILVYLAVAIMISVIAPQSLTTTLFFVTVPLSIIGTTYLEMPYHEMVKEINIWVLVLIPFTLLLF